ncbi:MAG: Hsp20/alpha crystallin family protein [Patescibacteria group bacterium]
MAFFTKVSKNNNDEELKQEEILEVEEQSSDEQEILPDTGEVVQDSDWINKEETEGQLSIDVFQTKDDIIIKSTIAGVKPEDIDVAIDNDMVTIRGSRRQDESIKEEDYFYQECYWGEFSRSVILPTEVVADDTEASLKNGVLTLILPKSKKSKSVAVKVTSE